MENFKPIQILLLVIVLLFYSCKEEDSPVTETDVSSNSSHYPDLDGTLKTEFAKSLSQALVENVELRMFLKAEALKMMDADYDIPYMLVKDEIVSNGKTFEDILLGYFENRNELLKITEAIPLITIFIPTLPENSFSANKWKAETEIPYLAIRLDRTNDVPIISPEGEEYLLEAELVPSYPILVIKENERIITNRQVGFADTNSSKILKTVNGISFKFVDDIFDQNLQTLNSGSSSFRRTSSLDNKITDAYEIYKTEDGWQRDYVYYGITSASPNGPFLMTLKRPFAHSIS